MRKPRHQPSRGRSPGPGPPPSEPYTLPSVWPWGSHLTSLSPRLPLDAEALADPRKSSQGGGDCGGQAWGRGSCTVSLALRSRTPALGRSSSSGHLPAPAPGTTALTPSWPGLPSCLPRQLRGPPPALGQPRLPGQCLQPVPGQHPQASISPALTRPLKPFQRATPAAQ